jgi:hypothetical protein
VPGLNLAGVNPDNTPSGYDWTFLFPMLLFIVIAVILYMLFSRPHRRVPGRPITSAGIGGVPRAEVAQAASVAAGLGAAPGGGTAASVHEPEGAVLVAEHDGADSDTAGTEDDSSADDATQAGQAAPDRTEGSE